MAILVGKIDRPIRPAPFFGIASAILGLILLVAPVDRAVACSVSGPLMDYKNTIKEIRASDAVFIGTVVSASNASAYAKESEDSVARIRVETVLKGKLSRHLKLYAGNFRGCLGFTFRKDARYLIFATKESGWFFDLFRPARYRLSMPWGFIAGKAPAEVMRALKDHKAGR